MKMAYARLTVGAYVAFPFLIFLAIVKRSLHRMKEDQLCQGCKLARNLRVVDLILVIVVCVSEEVDLGA